MPSRGVFVSVIPTEAVSLQKPFVISEDEFELVMGV